MALFDPEDKKLFLNLLKPSWLSGLIAITAGLLVSLGVIGLLSLHNTSFHQQIDVWQKNQPGQTLTRPGEQVKRSGHSTLQDSWPLLFVWGAVGLTVYFVTMSVIHSVSEAEALRESLGYVHTDPNKTLKITAGHIILRAMSGIFLIIFGLFFKNQIFPYAVTAAKASYSNIISLDGFRYALLSFAVIALGTHIMAILLRLTVGKPRVFSQ